MLWSSLLLSDPEGSLEETEEFCIPALLALQHRQVRERRSSLGMLRPQELLSNPSPSVERFRLGVRAKKEIHRCLVEQTPCFFVVDVILFAHLSCDDGLQQQTFILLPGAILSVWKRCIDCEERPLCPDTPLCLRKLVLNHCLHQAMNRERLLSWIAPDQRVGPQCLDHLAEQKIVLCHSRKG